MSILREGQHDKAWNDPPVLAYDGNKSLAQGRAILGRKRQTPPNEQIQSGGVDARNILVPEMQETMTRADERPMFSNVSRFGAVPETDGYDVEDTTHVLEECLEQCRGYMSSAIKEDVQKRLSILRSQWQNKLSDDVKRKMYELAIALRRGDCEKANELHLALIVDYVGEVGQWMVGIKHMIRVCQMQSQNSADSNS